jgi:hypothetical protein
MSKEFRGIRLYEEALLEALLFNLFCFVLLAAASVIPVQSSWALTAWEISSVGWRRGEWEDLLQPVAA